jgi:hypothetical protein
MNEQATKNGRVSGNLNLLVRWVKHLFGKHTSTCKCAGSWDMDTGKRRKGHHCRVTGLKTSESQHT